MHFLTGYYHQKKAAALLWQHLSITTIDRSVDDNGVDVDSCTTELEQEPAGFSRVLSFTGTLLMVGFSAFEKHQ